jgi:hypothetical protein
MTHIAIQEVLDGVAVEWMEKVSDEQYQGGQCTRPDKGAVSRSSNMFGFESSVQKRTEGIGNAKAPTWKERS